MKQHSLKLVGILAMAVLGPVLCAYGGESNPSHTRSVPVGTGFTYQGRLKQAGVPVNETCDFMFTLSTHDGIVVGDIQTAYGQTVHNGLFTVVLNESGEFGPDAFIEEARLLGVGVRCPAGVGNFIHLSPHQALRASPFALKTRNIDGHSLDAADGAPVDAVYVDDDGHVDIGTAVPGTKLEVVGTVTAGAFEGDGSGLTGLPSSPWEVSGSDIFYASGSVGIGTAGPLPPGDTISVKSATLPSERQELACAACPSTGKIFRFGGFNSVSRFDEIVEYDPPGHPLLQAGDPGDGTVVVANS